MYELYAYDLCSRGLVVRSCLYIERFCEQVWLKLNLISLSKSELFYLARFLSAMRF